MSTRATLQSLKLEAYELYNVSNTKQLKKLLGKGYDFRRRSTWLEILGRRDRPVCNIVPFEPPLSVLFRWADAI